MAWSKFWYSLNMIINNKYDVLFRRKKAGDNCTDQSCKKTEILFNGTKQVINN